MILEEICSNSI